MYDEQEHLLYVGKAANLKKRLASYFARTLTSAKTEALVRQIARIEITITNNTTEALILEANLIKSRHPKYNIVLRDDKSYPYIYISGHSDYPRMCLHRGKNPSSGRLFGPYPDANSAKETLKIMQKIFKIRNCSDSFFKNRSRPCLQYYIDRCTAPCVKLVSPAAYRHQIEYAQLFLEGNNNQVISALVAQMEQLSEQLEFERAAIIRDQITHLQKVLNKVSVEQQTENFDLVLAYAKNNLFCVELLQFKHGRMLGAHTFYPSANAELSEAELLSIFIAQYYLTNSEAEIPAQILLAAPISDQELLAQALSQQAGQRVILKIAPKSKTSLFELAAKNAEHALEKKIFSVNHYQERLFDLQKFLDLTQPITQMECFDISHSQGTATVASCVVFDANGRAKEQYRRYNITGITPGDDYAAMHQVLTRRYQHLINTGANLPDLIIIDGGKGQLKQATQVLQELNLTDITVISIAKGSERKKGAEKIYLMAQDLPLNLANTRPAFHLLQHIRDEAHRFAITQHRRKRAAISQHSILEDIPGIGEKRRQKILNWFGGLQELKDASIEQLSAIPGISSQLARLIYAKLHDTRK